MNKKHEEIAEAVGTYIGLIIVIAVTALLLKLIIGALI